MRQKTLIIPDIHNRFERAEEVIRLEKPTLTVFLGDYFDDFGDDATIARQTARWLSVSVQNPKRIHLVGNHDVHYLLDKEHRCSGFTVSKYNAIQEIIDTKKLLRQLYWFYVLDKTWLLTHAGLHRHHFPSYLSTDKSKCLDNVAKFLDKQVQHLLTDEPYNWIVQAGFGRGGMIPSGGFLWCDFQREFVDIKNLNQIFGHTPLPLPIWCFNNNEQESDWLPFNLKKRISTAEFNAFDSCNLALDTHFNHYAVWNGKSLTIKQVVLS